MQHKSWLYLLILMSEFLIISSTNQSTLIRDLFNDYYEGVIPKCSGTTGPIPVYIDIALRQIIELNARQQILTTNAWIRLYWTDCQLVWNPSNYGGIDTLVLPFDKIWVPDMTLYDSNKEETSKLSGYDEFQAILTSDGRVQYNFPTVMSSLCKIDSTFFPFDSQACPLKFSSWSYDGSEIDAYNKSPSGDLLEFKMNTEWDVTSLDVVRNVKVYACCPNPYTDVTYTLRMNRKSASYVVNLLVPCVLITSIALFGFILPPDCGEKVGLEITVLLALAFFSLVVSDALPPSENVPYVGVYFACSLIMVTISLLLTVIVLNIHYRGQLENRLPDCVKKLVFGVLSPLLLLTQRNDQVVAPIPIEADATSLDEESCSFTKSPRLQKLMTIDKTKNDEGDIFHEQLRVLQFFRSKFEEKDKDDDLKKEWERVAIVLDRLFFVIFFIFHLLCTIAILMKAAI